MAAEPDWTLLHRMEQKAVPIFQYHQWFPPGSAKLSAIPDLPIPCKKVDQSIGLFRHSRRIGSLLRWLFRFSDDFQSRCSSSENNLTRSGESKKFGGRVKMQIGSIKISDRNEIAVSAHHGLSESGTPLSQPIEWTEFDAIFLLAETAHSVIYELEIPAAVSKKDLPGILFNELLHRLPIEPEEIFWLYRKIDATHYKLAAIRRDQLDKVKEVR